MVGTEAWIRRQQNQELTELNEKLAKNSKVFVLDTASNQTMATAKNDMYIGDSVTKSNV